MQCGGVARGLASRLRLKPSDFAQAQVPDWVARGLASRLRLKRPEQVAGYEAGLRRQGIGFSPEIETAKGGTIRPPFCGRQGIGFSPEIETNMQAGENRPDYRVARGLASRLRLKQFLVMWANRNQSRQGIGFSPEIETSRLCQGSGPHTGRQGIGFSPEIETLPGARLRLQRQSSPGDWLLA